MDEKTADALREVVQDVAQAIELGTRSGEALISFLEDMLTSIETWAAKYNVSLNSKPAMPMDLDHPSSQVNPTNMRQDINENQVSGSKEREAEHLGEEEASSLHSAHAGSHGVLFEGRNSVGISGFQADYERARMQSEERSYGNHLDTCGSAYDGKAQMQLLGEASRHACFLETTRAGALREHVKEERSLYSKHESVGAGAVHISPYIDNVIMPANVTPSLVHKAGSNAHVHHAGMHACEKPADEPKPASTILKLDVAMHIKTEPHAYEQKGKEIDSDWLHEDSSA